MKKQFKSTYPAPLPLVDGTEGDRLDYCGIRCSMEVLGGKWKLLIVSLLADREMRYGELKDSIEGISEKMLIRSLRDLEHHHLVSRVTSEVPNPAVTYSLTEYGTTVIPLLRTLFQWGDTHISKYPELIFH